MNRKNGEGMKKLGMPVIAGLLLAATVLIPRLFAGSLMVRYDILFWHSHGNGYAPTEIALGAKLLAAALVIGGLAGVIGSRPQRAVWALIMLLSALAFISISRPSDYHGVISQGNKLIGHITSFHNKKHRFPYSLNELEDVPQTGLASDRRFYYASDSSKQDDKGAWFHGAKRYLGKASFVICVPFVPGGTLVYRPDGDYSDLPGNAEPDGWFHTTVD